MSTSASPTKSAKPPSSSPDSASLLHRLAGPSTEKAGLAKDQSEINRIIAEVSKGSKFYENEKRKDKELTEKIEKILKERDELLKQADIPSIERGVDRLINELEAERDLSQVIVHVDMDAFFANVEMLDNPALAGKPFGVGHGVLTTASYEARKFGVRSGMAGFVAKKLCPELILVPIHHERYSEISQRIMTVFRDYDPNMLAASCDEGYLNITSYCAEHDLDPDECVQQMRKRVHEEIKLTVSAGIAPNKMLAKNKPNGQYHLPFERTEIRDFMRDLPIRKIPGIGRVSERLLDSIGVKTCGDIYPHRATLSLLDKHFSLHWLLQTYLGIASNVVQPGSREERKSIGAERTFNPISNREKLLQKLDEVAHELEEDMTRGGWVGKTITLKYKLSSYQVFTRAKSFDRWISKKDDLFSARKELLLNDWPLELRLIGLRVTKLKDLRAEEQGDAGIKRFLKPASSGPASPRKRRKVSDTRRDREGSVISESESPHTSEPDDGQRNHGETDEHPAAEPPGLTCPICSKILQTDNDGLNTHIDWCLSRGAILEAATTEGPQSIPTKRVEHTKPTKSSSGLADRGGTDEMNDDAKARWERLFSNTSKRIRKSGR
ncbi:IMS-domain-containing protein [Punctularia strigosozonata HHB-11173 SS5]|uniref:IMS-domain-containing protein n=1 Tax=Punctularia strigosozonata (strain HHB-11173) TaxID=741275 RepID=UPI000441812B|nr:IMS-domain-containing protein [Punctularia strigosozonata HHB-11173 SS5]EIN11671.1 IMS-domain-containing protein [Punctularia strigosozonata HHB-11173 SS5]